MYTINPTISFKYLFTKLCLVVIQGQKSIQFFFITGIKNKKQIERSKFRLLNIHLNLAKTNFSFIYMYIYITQSPKITRVFKNKRMHFC